MFMIGNIGYIRKMDVMLSVLDQWSHGILSPPNRQQASAANHDGLSHLNGIKKLIKPNR